MSLHQRPTGSAGPAAGASSAVACSAAKPVPAADVLQRLEEERDKLSKNQVKRLRKQLAKKVKQENDSSATATAVTTSSLDDEADGSLTQPPAPKRARHAPSSDNLHQPHQREQQHHQRQHQQMHSGITCSDAAQPCSSILVDCNTQAMPQLQQWVPGVPMLPIAGAHVVSVPYGMPVLAAGAIQGVYGIAALPAPVVQHVPAAAVTGGQVHAAAGQAHSHLQHGHVHHAATGHGHIHLPHCPPVHRRGNHVDLSAAATLITWAGAQEQSPATPAAALAGARGSFSAGGTGGPRQQPCRTDLSGGVLLVSQEMEAISLGSGSRAGALAVAAAAATAAATGAVQAAEEDSLAQGSGGVAIHVHYHHLEQQQPEQQQDRQQMDEEEEEQEQEQEHQQAAHHAQQQQEGQHLSKRQARQRFIYGNYHNYYGLRLGQSRQEDPRVKLLVPSWFRDQDCLDIGCNEGVVTLAMATKFCARRMTGVDIDRVLISKAATNLAQMRSRLTQQLHARGGNGRDAKQPAGSISEQRRRIKALAHTEFRQGDWVELPCRPCRYDAITVFSVTKWVHLHYGDDGLMGFFHKLFRSLVPGGVLVLEPQPWKSYQNAKNKQVLKEVPYAERIDQLHLRPSGFADFLTQRVGFELLCTLQVDREEAAQGFDRPMLVLRRPVPVVAGDPLAQIYDTVH